MTKDHPPTQLIWATRGRSWGFRFLLSAGLVDPLSEYERAFSTMRDEREGWDRHSAKVALRLTDPRGRRDTARRVIPHEFVVFGDLAEQVNSVEDGLTLVWPLVAEAYARVWDSATPPSADQLDFEM